MASILLHPSVTHADPTCGASIAANLAFFTLSLCSRDRGNASVHSTCGENMKNLSARKKKRCQKRILSSAVAHACVGHHIDAICQHQSQRRSFNPRRQSQKHKPIGTRLLLYMVANRKLYRIVRTRIIEKKSKGCKTHVAVYGGQNGVSMVYWIVSQSNSVTRNRARFRLMLSSTASASTSATTTTTL